MKKKINKILLGVASWDAPVLGINCPQCGIKDNYWEQFRDHESPFEVCRSADREELEDIKWKCPHCKTIFELEQVEF